MDQDLQVRQPRHHARKDQPRHGGAGLVGPAEDGPDLVFRFALGREVGDVRGARRMQQHRLARFRRHLEDRKEARLVEAGAVDVGMELQTVGVAAQQDALRLLHGGVGCAHRQRAHIAGEAIRIFGAQLGEAVIGDAGEFGGLVRARHRFERRQPEREYLRVVVELVHHLAAGRRGRGWCARPACACRCPACRPRSPTFSQTGSAGRNGRRRRCGAWVLFPFTVIHAVSSSAKADDPVIARVDV